MTAHGFAYGFGRGAFVVGSAEAEVRFDAVVEAPPVRAARGREALDGALSA